MRFTKMEGLGNDYIYIDCTKREIGDFSLLARRMSDRHFGIGGDGIICICPSQRADFAMRMFNADGSEGKMCGNGIRCVGKYVYEKGLTDKTDLKIETLSGIRQLMLHLTQERVERVTVDMGIPEFLGQKAADVDGVLHEAWLISMGNPHAVTFWDEVQALELAELGPKFESHPAFSQRVNTEFIRVLGPTSIEMRVWERGSGETLACGTGSCAALVAGVLSGRTARACVVHLLGGPLSVRWDEEDGHIYMTGPAVTVFEGEWPDEAV